MIPVYIYGFGILVLLTRICNYDIYVFECLIIGVIGFGITRTLFKNLKNTVITTLALLVLSTIAGVILYYFGYLTNVTDFLKRFFGLYIKTFDSNYDITLGLVHEVVLIALFSIPIYKILYAFKDNKRSYPILVIVTFSTCAIAFLTGQLSSIEDRKGFCIFILCNIFYFFYQYFTHHKEQYRDSNFTPYLALCGFMAVMVIGISYLLFLKVPRPFELPQKEDTSAQTDHLEVINDFQRSHGKRYSIEETSTISDTFEYENIELFQVKTSNVKYLKGAVFENYSNGNWEKASDDTALLKYNGTTEKITDLLGSEYIMISYTKMYTDTLFLGGDFYSNLDLDGFVNFKTDEMRNTAKIIGPTEFLQMSGLYYRYRSFYYNEFNPEWIKELKMDDVELSVAIEDTAYAMPEGMEDVAALAQDITQGISNPYDKVQAVIQYLNDNYTYNTKPAKPEEDEDPIRYFLFTSHEGFCQQFASSAALMLRSVGIPTRYVTGFIVDTSLSMEEAMHMAYVPVGVGFKAVYDSDAHAWFEAYFPSYGWVRFETTPGFIQEEQKQTWEVAVETQQQEVISIEEELDVKYIAFIGLAFLLALVILYIYRLRKRILKFKNEPASNRVQIYYWLILDYLGLVGLRSYFYETPREHANRIDDEIELADKLKLIDLIDIYENVIYGQNDISQEQLEVFKGYLNQLKKYVYKKRGRSRCLKVGLKEKLCLYKSTLET